MRRTLLFAFIGIITGIGGWSVGVEADQEVAQGVINNPLTQVMTTKMKFTLPVPEGAAFSVKELNLEVRFSGGYVAVPDVYEVARHGKNGSLRVVQLVAQTPALPASSLTTNSFTPFSVWRKPGPAPKPQPQLSAFGQQLLSDPNSVVIVARRMKRIGPWPTNLSDLANSENYVSYVFNRDTGGVKKVVDFGTQQIRVKATEALKQAPLPGQTLTGPQSLLAQASYYNFSRGEDFVPFTLRLYNGLPGTGELDADQTLPALGQAYFRDVWMCVLNGKAYFRYAGVRNWAGTNQIALSGPPGGTYYCTAAIREPNAINPALDAPGTPNMMRDSQGVTLRGVLAPLDPVVAAQALRVETVNPFTGMILSGGANGDWSWQTVPAFGAGGERLPELPASRKSGPAFENIVNGLNGARANFLTHYDNHMVGYSQVKGGPYGGVTGGSHLGDLDSRAIGHFFLTGHLWTLFTALEIKEWYDNREFTSLIDAEVTGKPVSFLKYIQTDSAGAKYNRLRGEVAPPVKFNGTSGEYEFGRDQKDAGMVADVAYVNAHGSRPSYEPLLLSYAAVDYQHYARNLPFSVPYLALEPWLLDMLEAQAQHALIAASHYKGKAGASVGWNMSLQESCLPSDHGKGIQLGGRDLGWIARALVTWYDLTKDPAVAAELRSWFVALAGAVNACQMNCGPNQSIGMGIISDKMFGYNGPGGTQSWEFEGIFTRSAWDILRLVFSTPQDVQLHNQFAQDLIEGQEFILGPMGFYPSQGLMSPMIAVTNPDGSIICSPTLNTPPANQAQYHAGELMETAARTGDPFYSTVALNAADIDPNNPTQYMNNLFGYYSGLEWNYLVWKWLQDTNPLWDPDTH